MLSLAKKRKQADCLQSITSASRQAKVDLKLGYRYQMYGGTREQTKEEKMKRLAGEVDYLPKPWFDGHELIPGNLNEIVAEGIWPRIQKDKSSDRLIELEAMLDMRQISKFWLEFVDKSTAMHDQHMHLLST